VTYYLTPALLALPFVGVYAMLAIGIVLIYRASKVLNLAHGVMASLPAYLLFSLAELGVPLVLSFPLAVAGGGALGWLVERVFVRPMRAQSTSTQTVGTVVVLGVSIAAMAQLWGTASRLPVSIFPSGPDDFIAVGSSNIRYGEIGLFVTMLVVFAGLTVLFRFSDLGLLLRGAAENPRAASLMGVNPERMTAVTWILGGALAGLAGILLAAITSLQPYTLPLQALPAFLAALLGGLGSLTGALVGGVAVGLVLSFVPILPGLRSVQGSSQLLLTVIGLVVMAARGKRLSAMGAVE
jgi:branched-subunit amino acid ABC-type transport system permease component